MSTLDLRSPATESEAGLLAPSWWENRPRRYAALAFGAWLLSGMYLVPTDQQAVVTRFGAVTEPRVLPGLHLSLPWPIDRVTRLKVRQLQRLVAGGDAADAVVGRTDPSRAQFLTGDQNLIHLRAVVQYYVAVPADYLFQPLDVSAVIRAAVETELSRKISSRGVDAVLTTEKAAIQEDVRGEAQKRLNDYRAGVALASVNIESVLPPAETAEAFRDVASARADAVRIVNEAQGYANDILPKARGEARQLIESAEAFKQRKINEAAGDAARFTEIAVEYAKAAEVTGDRLYQEAMVEILPRIRKLIVDKNGNLDLTIIRRAEPAAKPQ
ncbi:MAG: FtsH protease activity modulator HflK [Bryobacteraceae bacterium]